LDLAGQLTVALAQSTKKFQLSEDELNAVSCCPAFLPCHIFVFCQTSSCFYSHEHTPLPGRIIVSSRLLRQFTLLPYLNLDTVQEVPCSVYKPTFSWTCRSCAFHPPVDGSGVSRTQTFLSTLRTSLFCISRPEQLTHRFILLPVPIYFQLALHIKAWGRRCLLLKNHSNRSRQGQGHRIDRPCRSKRPRSSSTYTTSFQYVCNPPNPNCC